MTPDDHGEERRPYWGWKATISVYMAGDHLLATDMLDRLDETFPGAHFIGAQVESVEHEPKDQVAT